MANFMQPANNTRKETPYTKDALDQPCDVVLVVLDDKEFKAHRKILSEASPFFEKLLSTDMKESKEGIVRLEMFSESVMAATLEFIYTGHVKILTEDNARELIVMADYLLLEKLKTIAEGFLAQEINISNCISTYYFSLRYKCEELIPKSKKFILVNFSAVYAANPEDVLNMSNKEVEMWISSDEIDVRAEEVVFRFILAWVDHDKSKRKKYFADLFRQVRLVYVTRDFLSSDVVTNDLVKENEGCLVLVKYTMSLMDSKNCDIIPVSPRSALEAPAIAVRNGEHFLCYFPGEDNWCRLGKIPSEFKFVAHSNFIHCKGKLYTKVHVYGEGEIIVSYDPYTNFWVRFQPFQNRCLWEIFAGSEDELYGVVCAVSAPYGPPELCQEKPTSFISKYKPESRSWEDIASFDHFHPEVRRDYCIVTSGHFIYFIGGELSEIEGCFYGKPRNLSDVDRYDLKRGQWDKLADIQIARKGAHGAAVNGKVFIAGGCTYHEDSGMSGRMWSGDSWDHSFEMYDETTDEWQFIKPPDIRNIERRSTLIETILAADGKLFGVYRLRVAEEILVRGRYYSNPSLGKEDRLEELHVYCYDPQKNEWKTRFGMTSAKRSSELLHIGPTMRIFKELYKLRPLETSESTCSTSSSTTLIFPNSWRRLYIRDKTV